MSRWLIRILFVLAVGGVIGSAVWNNIATNRLIEQATSGAGAQQVAALSALAQRDDFFDLIQSRKLPARLRVADGVEAINNADGVKIALAMLRGNRSAGALRREERDRTAHAAAHERG